jgi:SAM-dependent methyltransferase
MSNVSRSVDRLTGRVERNVQVWAEGHFVRSYASQILRPAEATFLIKYAEFLQGRILELGAGAGRITGYLGARGGDVLAVDISPEMVEYARGRYPGATFVVGDLRDLSSYSAERWDVVVAAFNVLGVLDDPGRRTTLRAIGQILAPGGLFYFSAHNAARLEHVQSPFALVISARDPARFVWNLLRAPRRARNRRRLRQFEQREGTYALANDEAHDFQLLHYYITRDEQERQLDDAGFDLLECLDEQGNPVPGGSSAPESVELHYVARARTA